jgi:hypothetical protein
MPQKVAALFFKLNLHWLPPLVVDLPHCLAIGKLLALKASRGVPQPLHPGHAVTLFCIASAILQSKRVSHGVFS